MDGLFNRPEPKERTFIQKLGGALGGFGAGVQGKGAEYEAAFEARKQEEERKRLAAMVKDAKTTYDLLNTGNLVDAQALIQDRIQMINRLGGDPSDTARIGAMLESGRIGEAQNELRSFLRPFMPTEAIPTSEVTSEGQMFIRDPITGKVNAEDVAGFRVPVDGQVPATFRSLQMQAEAAGLTPDTDQYRDFMRFGGGDAALGGRGLQRFANGTAIQYMPDGGVRVIHPVKGEITDPAEKQEEIDLAFSSGSIEAGAIAAAQAQAQGEEQRAQSIINEGIAAADSTGVLRRAIELLDLVDTGGFAKYGLAARRIFGIEGADEGELSSNLGKAVLSQLRSTFGAAFTAKEGESLKEIEAGFGFNTETNKRLLNNALAIANRAAQRAIRRAEAREDFETSSEIEAALDFDISNFLQEIENQVGVGNGNGQPVPRPTGPQVIRFDAQGNIIPD